MRTLQKREIIICKHCHDYRHENRNLTNKYQIKYQVIKYKKQHNEKEIKRITKNHEMETM